jgi:hypothetical protein
MIVNVIRHSNDDSDIDFGLSTSQKDRKKVRLMMI